MSVTFRSAVAWRTLAAVGLLSTAACGLIDETASPVTSPPLVRVGEVTLGLDEFLSHVAGTVDRTEPPDDYVLSRLFDQWVDEELLVQEAERSGIEIVDSDLTGYLQWVRSGREPADPADGERYRESLRRQLLVEELVSRRIAPGDEVGYDEVRAHYAENEQRFEEPARVVLIQLLLDRPQDVEELLELLEEGEPFPALAEQYSLSPDGGQRRSYRPEELPEPIREALDGLDEGELTEVVELGGRYYLFQLVERERRTKRPLAEARPEIERELQRRRHRARYRHLVEELRGSADFEVHDENLPFDYRPPAASEPEAATDS